MDVSAMIRGLMIVVLAGLALSGCSDVREKFGLIKRAPDEFTVLTKAPLILPPNYTLRPPKPGGKQRQAAASSARARAALVTNGRSAIDARAILLQAREGAKGPASKGENLLLQRAGATGANDDIRAVIDRETDKLAKADESLIDRLLFWRERTTPSNMVDATKESRRLRRNAALGKPVNEGDVPMIEYKRRGLFD